MRKLPFNDTFSWLGRYVLDKDGQPVPAPDLLEWGEWLGTSLEQRRVAFDDLGSCQVSTVFLALDHSYVPMTDPLRYKPILWETAVFNKDDRVVRMQRYHSREDALTGHAEIVADLRKETINLTNPENRQ
jgi:hypothetical protein